MVFNNRLKEIRMKEFGMDQKEFARFLDVNNTTYCNWELGISCPTLKKAFEIGKKINKKIDDIWYLED